MKHLEKTMWLIFLFIATAKQKQRLVKYFTTCSTEDKCSTITSKSPLRVE